MTPGDWTTLAETVHLTLTVLRDELDYAMRQDRALNPRAAVDHYESLLTARRQLQVMEQLVQQEAMIAALRESLKVGA